MLHAQVLDGISFETQALNALLRFIPIYHPQACLLKAEVVSLRPLACMFQFNHSTFFLMFFSSKVVKIALPDIQSN